MEVQITVVLDEIGEKKILGPEYLQEVQKQVAVIQERMKMAQSQQKSYTNRRSRNLEFAIGDQVYVKILPMKGVVRFEKMEKLSPRYVGPYEVVEKIGVVAYRLNLPVDMQGVDNIFHVSSLKKSFGERPAVIMETSGIQW